MEMTIDEHIKILKSYHNGFTGYVSNLQDSIDVAMDIMHKYQTMQEVLEKVWNVPSCMLDEAECLNKIMETYRTVR